MLIEEGNALKASFLYLIVRREKGMDIRKKQRELDLFALLSLTFILFIWVGRGRYALN